MYAKEGYEVDQRREALAAKPGPLNLIPGTHEVGEENRLLQVVRPFSLECGAYKLFVPATTQTRVGNLSFAPLPNSSIPTE